MFDVWARGCSTKTEENHQEVGEPHSHHDGEQNGSGVFVGVLCEDRDYS